MAQDALEALSQNTRAPPPMKTGPMVDLYCLLLRACYSLFFTASAVAFCSVPSRIAVL
jgi:hypothetical protein